MSTDRSLVFLTSFEYPSRYAHPIHGLNMANAFARVLSNRFLFVYGGKAKSVNFSDMQSTAPFGVWARRLHLRSLLYALWFFTYSAAQARAPWVLLNDARIGLPILFARPLARYRVVFEIHKRYRFADPFIYRFADSFVFVTSQLRSSAESRYPHIKGRSIVLPNGVDLNLYDVVTDEVPVLRRELKLPVEKRIIGYTGRLRPMGLEKGVARLIDILTKLPERYILCCVGGTEDENLYYRRVAEDIGAAERVIFVPHVSQGLLPQYTKSFDLLAYVPGATNDFFTVETSPMKLFEYMAAGRPILVSDLPTVREILDDGSAFFIRPDASSDIVAANIEKIFSDPETAARKQTESKARARVHTWEGRARSISDLIGISASHI